MFKYGSIFFAFLMCFLTCAFAQPQNSSWESWVQQLRGEAIEQGIRPDFFDKIFNTIPTPSNKVLHFYSTQPERRLTFLEYRKTRVDPTRISMGKQALRAHRALLDEIERQYGVDSSFVLALWGLETSYGHFMGSFPVLSSLATLAYDSRRPDFFRGELFKGLRMLQDGQVTLEDFKGEWAGASGHPQFLPSSWYKYAVDEDGDGRKNIWTSLPDGLASIANYLSKNGWRSGEPSAIEVNLPANFDPNFLGKNTIKSVAQWQGLGVRLNDKTKLNAQLPASIIRVGDEGGATFMIFNNFRTLQTWNDSNYYVATVIYLANQIRA